ncbi:MAG: hypothetical protein Q8S54_08790 [Bacteroidota bacterium]|nr:hypothetical protein [Bacteroidota bacterium]
MKFNTLTRNCLILALVVSMFASVFANEPVNPKATPEAKALLELHYRISGK